MSQAEVRMTIRVPKGLHEAAKAKAKAEDVTISQIVRWYLKAWVQDELFFVVPRSDREPGDE